MPEYRSLADYYDKNGITDTNTKEEIQSAKLAYQRYYQNRYYTERTTQVKRLNIRMSFEEYERFSHLAKLHGSKSVNKFLIQTSLSYIQELYIPRDPDQLEKALIAFSRIGNNINQVVRSIHQTKKYNNFNGYYGSQETLQVLELRYTDLVKKVDELRLEMQSLLTSKPKSLSKVLLEYVKQDPQAIDQLILALAKMKK